MLVIDIISANGVAPDPPVSARVEAGGSVGRAPHNSLALPDAERRVSRVHAQFVQRRGVVRILARGTSPLRVDGESLDMGEERDLPDGARLELGGYVLRVRVGAPATVR